jgi:AAA domain
MDDALLGLVLDRLGRTPLADAAADLLLAACDSDESLTTQLSGTPAPAIRRTAGAEPSDPAGAYLRSVTVAGFRGVGPPATLTVEPGPGLTVIVGRNGSGKSSFAEGLEVLLTGDLKRWADLSAVWREGWRNLHASDPAEITAEFLLEDAGPTTVSRTWASGAGFGDSAASVQVAGQKRTGLDRLGWRDALVTYRPFLSHTELEAFLGKPSQLYDLLSSVLGLEDLTQADERLSRARKEREGALAAIRKELPPLLDRLRLVDDERASACRNALSGKTPDIGQARTIAMSGAAAPPGTELGRLRMLSQLAAPSPEQVKEAAAAIGRAAEKLAETAGSDAGQAHALAELLSLALDHYRVHGTGSCPVCGQAAALDEGWRARTEEAMTGLRVQAAAAEEALALAELARVRAREIFPPLPVVLSGTPVAGVDPRAALAAWGDWLSHPQGEGMAGSGGRRNTAGCWPVS